MNLRILLSLAAGFPFSVFASLPEIPFSGSFGATVGAGAALGWERNGFGINPAASDPGNTEVSLSGYSPFGLEGVDLVELAASRDGRRFGTSMTYRGLYDEEGGSAFALQLQESVLLFRGIRTGASVKYQDDENGKALDGGVGMIWNAFSFLTLAGFTETYPRPWGTTLNNEFGADFGVNLKGAYAWRFGIEQIYNVAEGMDWRFGAALHLHALLSLYSGWSPRAQTIALGIRFGMGNWEGFSALRRHSVLGTTSIQGLHWRKETKPPNR